jgi:hypothetical protein
LAEDLLNATKTWRSTMNTPQIETVRMVQARLAPGALLRNKWLLMAVAVLALVAIVAASWSWLMAAGLATILVSALPCLVMCGLGLCMHRYLDGSGSAQASGSATADAPGGMARAATNGSATYAASCCGGATLVPPANALPEGDVVLNEKREM